MAVKNENRLMEGTSVLIVDDSPYMRKFVANSLRLAGLSFAKIFEAGNGAEGLAVIAAHRVELILVDINMPIMDGLEFVRSLVGVVNAAGVPVVIISAEGSELKVVDAISVGACAYIRKPFSPDQIRKSVVPLLAVKTTQ